MTTHSACPVCESKITTQISSRDRHSKPLITVLCDGCGHVYNDPIPSPDELERFYRDDYRKIYKGTHKPRLRQISRNFEGTLHYVRRWQHLLRRCHKVLDVGCGSGEFLYLMKSLGQNVRGIEPNLAYADYCRDVLGLNVETKFLEDIMSDHEEYDFIRLSHVLEHCPDPVRTLQQIRKKLSPTGIVYVEVPNIQAYSRSKSRGNIFHYGHISNFSPWTLRAAARRAGLRELEECRDSLKHETALFLGASDSVNASYALSTDNAQHIRDSLSQHYTQRRETTFVMKKLLIKTTTRLREVTDTVIALGSAKRIGDLYAMRLKRGLATKAPQSMMEQSGLRQSI